MRAVLMVVATAAASCGGGGGSYNSPTSATPVTTGGATTTAAVTVDIVATSGAQSFTPNPASQVQGATIAWRNRDGVVHRIVANDGSFDTGTISPGATSPAIAAPAAGVNYHCSIHPGMVGAIGTRQGEPPPPCSGMYCD